MQSCGRDTGGHRFRISLEIPDDRVYEPYGFDHLAEAACAAMSKQHVAGQKGTPFSNCVAAGAKLLKNQHKNP